MGNHSLHDYIRSLHIQGDIISTFPIFGTRKILERKCTFPHSIENFVEYAKEREAQIIEQFSDYDSID